MVRAWLKHREEINRSLDQKGRQLAGLLTDVFETVGELTLFMVTAVRSFFTKPYRFDEVIKHMQFIGNKSVFIISLTGAFTGLALSYQIYLGFELVGATNLVGPTVALGISRELGPVLTGLIVSARAGGAMAARIGTMRVYEQIDSLEVMGINPIQYLVAPRVVAAVIILPLLCGVFDFVAMLGAHVLSVNVLGLDEAIFWEKIELWINPSDLNEGFLKSAVFGLVFASICSYKGYNTTGGAKGVGEATNQGVVNSMVLIIVLNFIMTNIIRLFYAVWEG